MKLIDVLQDRFNMYDLNKFTNDEFDILIDATSVDIMNLLRTDAPITADDLKEVEALFKKSYINQRKMH